ncbi:hypothetical protein N2601_04625 [Rhizobium sp. CB3060]|uniref:hypothetical protein n=1 Tax=Rhizobium sp. CB3060 TaxID=3138255 RepID=UPI0021A737B9|nr:hypothetical protein [Rhizobium tropici]UWU22268.1 hypothetical protein N2601_04625 [Rhizobium tropici]
MLSMGTGVASIVVTVSAEKAAVAQSTASASEETKPSPLDLISAPVRFPVSLLYNRSYDQEAKKR